jgi:alkanesulfonate monooxygenase SsuD/methylene tetrahydromethanopterin reductase-like flavin-dependent oxidoreductase (luciferase family)
MRPKSLSLSLVGAKADGWIGYFATPRFLDELVLPTIADGASAAGRDLADIDICAETICSVHPDREVALERARRQVGFYVIHPVSGGVVAMHGLSDQVDDLRRRWAKEGLGAFAHTADELVETLSITGTPEEARQKLTGYEGHLKQIALHCPYVPPSLPRTAPMHSRTSLRPSARGEHQGGSRPR